MSIYFRGNSKMAQLLKKKKFPALIRISFEITGLIHKIAALYSLLGQDKLERFSLFPKPLLLQVWYMDQQYLHYLRAC